MSRAETGLPPATARHRWPVRLVNGALRALNRLGFARVSLAEEKLIAAARKQCGLREFGDESFLEPMRLLLDCLEREAELNPLGRVLTRQSILRLLRNRLMARDLLIQHPEILERELMPPVVVMGLGRSGTTRLHRLMAADTRFVHLKSWESVHPVPWPESFGAARDPRETNIEMALKAVLYMSPQVASVHPLGANEVEEEIGLLQHGFSSQLFEIMAKVPTFAEWLMTHDQTPAYEYMVLLMKIVGWFRNDPPDRPWVMKTPQHMQDLDALMRVFPEARLVFTHRDPISVVGSVCSTAWNSMVRDTDAVDPRAIGSDWLDKIDRMLRKTLALRDGSIAPGRQYDVLYRDIGTDWESAMAGIYDWLEMPFAAEARAAMTVWLERNAQHRHGAHRYALEDFGLTADRVDEKLMYYRERFDIPYE